MKLGHYSEIKLEKVTIEGAKGAKIRWLVSQDDTAPNFAMRLFEIEEGGFTPFHNHEWEHEVFIVEGEGELVLQGDQKAFSQGHFIYVEPMRFHQFRNTGKSTMKFLCMVPHATPAVPKKKNVNPFAAGKANNC